VRNADQQTASDALSRLTDRATAGDTPWARALLSRSRALLTDGPDVERRFEEALALLADTPLRPDRARTQLLYGEWLRRERRRQDAREHLRAAHDTFTRMGAGFAGRAHSELAATGETARARNPRTANDLTRQEARVARMAAAGATNPEIASALHQPEHRRVPPAKGLPEDGPHQSTPAATTCPS
jgi:hypothetical protein